IAIANARLFEQVQQRNRQLTEALEQQTATSEILRVIATSPTDAQPVLDAVVEGARHLSDSLHAVLAIRETDHIRVVATAGSLGSSPPTGKRNALHIAKTDALTLRSSPVRTLVERRTIHIPDYAAPEVLAEFPDNETQPAKASVNVPLMHENEAIGVLQV